jgi:hypothetical protein
MSDFRTEIQITDAPRQISHNESLFLVGSCFAEHIGAKLLAHKFQLIENPFGILYNPLSILKFFKSIAKEKNYTPKDLESKDGIYCHFDAHGRLNDADQQIVCQNLNNSIQLSFQQIKKVSWLILSLGTSFYYEHRVKKTIVANCHKFPSSQFLRKRLSVEENFQTLTRISSIVKNLNPNINILLTVSPVRHIRDGLQENQLSKAALLLAVNQLQQSEENVFYFPSYELLLDDLRDYRFYKSDMLHPNTQAIEYIWQKFETSFIHPESRLINNKINEFIRGLNHKAFHPKSEKHLVFLRNLLKRIENFEADYPFIPFTNEKLLIRKQLQ